MIIGYLDPWGKLNLTKHELQVSNETPRLNSKLFKNPNTQNSLNSKPKGLSPKLPKL